MQREEKQVVSTGEARVIEVEEVAASNPDATHIDGNVTQASLQFIV